MMKLPRNAHAENSVLHESAPRRRPLQRATTSLLATCPTLGISYTNSSSEVKKTLYKGVILSRSLVARMRSSQKSSFTSLALLRSQDSPSRGPYGLFSQKSTAKTGLNPKSPALAVKRAVEQISMICTPPLSVNNAPTSSKRRSLLFACL